MSTNDARDELTWRALNAYPIDSVTVENDGEADEHHVYADLETPDHGVWITATGDESFVDLQEAR